MRGISHPLGDEVPHFWGELPLSRSGVSQTLTGSVTP